MKGIILAGGTGSRLFPLTKVTNKHLLPVGNKPMILHSVHKMTDAGITDIMIITGTEHMGAIVSLLGSGAEYGCQFTYRVQDRPDGIGGAMKLCKGFVGADKCLVILGDNIFEDSLVSAVKEFEASEDICHLFLKKVIDPERYGVAIVNKKMKVLELIEKPNPSPSPYCVTGIYMYTPLIFGIIEKLTPSRRGELEITEANNVFVQSTLTRCTMLKGYWTDAGTPESYYHANKLVIKHG